MMNEKEKLNLDFYSWEEIKQIFFDKNFKNVILFSQPRSGSTFVSNILSQEFSYLENFFPEEFFLSQHFVYLKNFIKKKNNFFININEYWVRRLDLRKENTMYLYLYRDTQEILNSYEKAKKFDYYMGWKEMIDRYRRFFPEIKNIEPAPLFGHKVWESQIKNFKNAYTVSYDSFRTHKFYLNSEIRRDKIKNLKDIELIENEKIKKFFTNEMGGKISHDEKIKVKFNFFENMYFFIRRKLENRKKNRRNY